MDYETKNGGTAAAADVKTLADRSAGVGGSNRPSKLLKWIKKDYGCILFLLPAILGFICAVISLVIFGPSNFILPALIVTVTLLFVCRRYLEPFTKEEEQA